MSWSDLDPAALFVVDLTAGRVASWHVDLGQVHDVAWGGPAGKRENEVIDKND